MLEQLKEKSVLFLEDNVDFAIHTIALVKVFVQNG
jgi:hypothetical protein